MTHHFRKKERKKRFSTLLFFSLNDTFAVSKTLINAIEKKSRSPNL